METFDPLKEDIKLLKTLIEKYNSIPPLSGGFLLFAFMKIPLVKEIQANFAKYRAIWSRAFEHAGAAADAAQLKAMKIQREQLENQLKDIKERQKIEAQLQKERDAKFDSLVSVLRDLLERNTRENKTTTKVEIEDQLRTRGLNEKDVKTVSTTFMLEQSAKKSTPLITVAHYGKDKSKNGPQGQLKRNKSQTNVKQPQQLPVPGEHHRTRSLSQTRDSKGRVSLTPPAAPIRQTIPSLGGAQVPSLGGTQLPSTRFVSPPSLKSTTPATSFQSPPSAKITTSATRFVPPPSVKSRTPSTPFQVPSSFGSTAPRTQFQVAPGYGNATPSTPFQAASIAGGKTPSTPSQPGGLEKAGKWILFVDRDNGWHSILSQTYLELLRIWTANTTPRRSLFAGKSSNNQWLFSRVSSAGLQIPSSLLSSRTNTIYTRPPILPLPQPKLPLAAPSSALETLLSDPNYFNLTDYPYEKETLRARIAEQSPWPAGIEAISFQTFHYMLTFDPQVAEVLKRLRASVIQSFAIADKDLPRVQQRRVMSEVECIMPPSFGSAFGGTFDPRTQPWRVDSEVRKVKDAIKRWTIKNLGWTPPTAALDQGPYRTVQLLLPFCARERLLDLIGTSAEERQAGRVKGEYKMKDVACWVSWGGKNQIGKETEQLVSLVGPKEKLKAAEGWVRWFCNPSLLVPPIPGPGVCVDASNLAL
jgi:hypothetical protein